jgi:hypothetical protein
MKPPSKFVPICAADFIGGGHFGAHTAALEIENLLAQARQNDNASIAFLINGRSGIGKSGLSRWILHDLLGIGPFSIVRKNGTEIDKDTVNQLAMALPYRDLYTDYKAIQFEECDAQSVAAQVRLLTFMDDFEESQGNILIATSNCSLKSFEPRYTSRFNVFELQPPTPAEIEGLLRRWLKHPGAIRAIANSCEGNVRAALKDADRQFAAENACVV